MTYPNAILSGHFTNMSIHTNGSVADVLADMNEATLKAAFATGEFTNVGQIRTMPAFGTPANIVNVAVFGQAISAQVQAQSDAPDMTFNVNYVPADWEASATLGSLVGDGNPYLFRISLVAAKPVTFVEEAAGIGTVQNSSVCFAAKLNSILVTPSTDDAVTADISLSMPTGIFFDPFTTDPA